MALVGTIEYDAIINTDSLDKGASKVSSTVKGIGAVTAAAVAAGAAAVTGLATASIKAFADYEQLVGGVDTLFKKNSDTVQQYAQNAYKTAGLSANQYMETVTSFSASLLQGLGGDTKKAAEIGNLAVTDMADNANKMGTSIESIQMAYQGFAKDNFTMLDNLKLGYGGTQAEMARLINDTGVMGEGFKATAENVKDIPFDKMIEAIHQVQTEMGITGTTAKEASETISGSFMATKAAWENVLTSFGTGNNEMIKAAIDGLIESAQNLVTNIMAILPNVLQGIGTFIAALVEQLPNLLTQLIPVLVNILTLAVQTIITALPMFLNAAVQLVVALVQGIAQAAPTLIPQIFAALKSMLDTIVQNLPLFLNAAVELITQLVMGIAKEAPTLIPQIIEAIMKMLDAIIKQLPLLIQAGITLLVALIEGLAKALPTLIKYIPKIIDSLVNALTDPQMIVMLVGAALRIILAIAGGLIQAIPQLIAAVPKLISSIVGAFDNIGSAALGIGKNLVQGIWNGINDATGWIISKVKGFGESVMNGLKSFFGIHSPSRLFRDEIGKNLALGVGEGFTDTMGAIAGDMQNAIPTPMVDVDSVGSFSASSAPTTVVVKVGEETIATKVIELINERTALTGQNAIMV